MKQLFKNIKPDNRLVCAKQLRYLFLFCLQAFSCFAFSQKQDLKFDHLTTLNGLSQSNVICFLHDSRGFMWVGSENGLNRYDGYNFIVYKNDPAKKSSLSNNHVTDIVEDVHGDLWIATWEGGLNKYDRQKDEFTHFKRDSTDPNSISDNYISCLLKDTKGDIWAGTSNGINVFDQKNSRFIKYLWDNNSNKSISNNSAAVIYEDTRHNIWIGTAEGLNLFNPEKKSFTHFLHNNDDPESLSSNKITSIFEDSKRRLWIGTNGGGLNLLDKQTGRFRIFKKGNTKAPGICDNIVYSITEDDEGMIWVASENNGISIFNPATETFTNYEYNGSNNTSLSSNSINRIYKDRKGNIWIGTYNAGINLFNKDVSKFIHYKYNSFSNSLSNNNVMGICEDRGNNIWIATDGGGLDLYNRTTGNFKNFRHEEGNKNTIAGNNVLSVLEDSYKNLWVGTYGNGVTVINKNKNTYKHYKNDPANPHSLGGTSGWVIYEDKEKNVWIGTPINGLSLYDRKNDYFIQYNQKKNNLSGNNVISIYEDSDGFLWIGTDRSGLNRLDKKTNKVVQFLHDDNKNSLNNNTVNSLYEDKNGNLWIGTNNGLNCLNRKTNFFTSYGVADGLPHEKVVGILEDDKGNLWISTSNGLSTFNLASKTFKNFGVGDGLQGNEFKQACWKTRSGRMYFGGINGFNEFFPDSIKANPYEPPLVFTNFQIFNKQVSIARDRNDPSPLKKNITETKEITLPYSSSVVSFEFATLNYISPDKKQYAYMLEGFDKTWNEVGTKHTATYTNLDPGKYVFKVKGLNNEGNWSSAITSIKLTVTPPFWMTWWFRIAVAIVVAGSVIVFYRVRINAVKRQRKLLQQKVKEQTIQLVYSNEEEQKARLEADKANIELEKKNTELEQFVYIASHDLREPLRTTTGFVELFQKQYKGKLDEKADKYLSYIAQSGNRMKRLIDDLLDYSKLGSKVELQQLDCNIILQEVLADLGIAVTEAGAKINAGHLPVISGHQTGIKQLFQNLIANGIKFRKKDVAPVIRITVEKSNASWKFSFAVNGIGIEKQHCDKIFEIFQRLHSRKEYEGSGIGLAHCKKIVELHKGNIWVASLVGGGSTFHFTLPIVQTGIYKINNNANMLSQ
jgi:ligand-binding sensor domain-containing protein/signal transduction histidine kinase